MIFAAFSVGGGLSAQSSDGATAPGPAPCVENMPGMRMCPATAAQPPASPSEPAAFLDAEMHHATAGTSAEPVSTPAPMLMHMRRGWMLMLHGNAFVTATQQSGPRGADKVFSTNWLMPMAERQVGPGQLTLRAMFSLEPATITGRQYPLLFQQGETAFGVPIADGQHPHDFFMELAALYDLRLGERTLLSLYAAPVGDPALGPTAYPHRASAAENPVGTLGHHQQDSTHIAGSVVTVGVTSATRNISTRIEASGFHGREPDEHRWNIDGGAIDSWSTRLTIDAGHNWSGQYSYGRLRSPEAQFPAEDQERMTASVMYSRPLPHGDVASTALWGRTRSLADSSKQNSYLLETAVRFATRNHAWTRLENAGRSNELLLGEHPQPPGFHEQPVGHVGAFTFGYDRDVDRPGGASLLPHVSTAVGAQVTAYAVPAALRPVYGGGSVAGVNLFVRFRLTGER